MIKLIVLCFLSLFSVAGAWEAVAQVPPHPSASILIFVSFAMPDASLKQWMRQAERIHAPIVVRGLVHNSLKETIQKMATLVRDNHGGVQIDPALFRRFQIKQVPAVVVWKEARCLPNQSCIETSDVIYGDVLLDFALQKIADQQDGVSEIANAAIAILHEDKHV